MIAASVVLSGSNFQKFSMFAKFLQLPILSKSTFYRMQRHYIVPSVGEHWIDHQNSVLEDFRGSDLVILGKIKRYMFSGFFFWGGGWQSAMNEHNVVIYKKLLL